MWGLFDQIRFFMYDPLNVKIVLASVLISLVAFAFLKFSKNISNSKKLLLTYLHIGAIIFPVIFFLYSAGCRAWFYGCSKTGAIIYISVLALISGGITALLVTPYFFIHKHIKKSSEIKDNFISAFVKRYAKKFNMKKPKLYLINMAKPIAFSFSNIKPYIFVSVGMTDILTKKELYAVVLHEMAHIINRSPSLKFSTFLMKFISPLASFTGINEKELDKDEKRADRFAIKVQKTDRYITSAKNKINEYNKFREES